MLKPLGDRVVLKIEEKEQTVGGFVLAGSAQEKTKTAKVVATGQGVRTLVQARENDLPEAIHVLGFTEKGRQHLKSLKGQVNLVSRIGKEPWDAMTQKADQIYQLGNPSIAEQNFGRVPIRIETN